MLQNLGPPFRRHRQEPCPTTPASAYQPPSIFAFRRPPSSLPTGPLLPERIRTEASIRRAHPPSCYNTARMLRWKWTTTRYYQVPSGTPGVDGRVHLIADSGWTTTRLGAAWAISAKLVRRG